MCMEDVWLARHTKKKLLGTASTVGTVPGNPNRIAIVIPGAAVVQVNGPSNQRWFYRDTGRFPTSTTGTVTTQAPPGTDTYNLTNNTGSLFDTIVIHVRDYGVLVQEAFTLPGTTGGAEVWEVEGDMEFERRYDKFEKGAQS